MGKRVHYVRAVSETEEHQLRTLANSRTQLSSVCAESPVNRQHVGRQPTDGLQSRHTGLDSKRGFPERNGFSDSTVKALKDSPINPGVAHRKRIR